MENTGTPFNDEELNASRERTPTVLVLDTSGSMDTEVTGSEDRRIDRLNNGLEFFKEEISQNQVASKKIDISIVTFGGEKARVKQEFTQINNWNPPRLFSSGKTPMADAIEEAIDRVHGVKQVYKEKGIIYNRPFIWLISDGLPDMDRGSDRWKRIQKQLEVGTPPNGKKFEFLAFAIEGTSINNLNDLVKDTNYNAEELNPGRFEQFFEFLSNSVEANEVQNEEFGFDQLD